MVVRGNVGVNRSFQSTPSAIAYGVQSLTGAYGFGLLHMRSIIIKQNNI
jgi:hypothetical protein